MSTEGGGWDREGAEKLGREYRQVASEFEELREKEDTGGEEILAIAEKVEKLWPRVKRPQEVVLDSKLVLGLAKMAVEKVEEVEVNAVAFKPADFALRLKERYGNGAAKQLMVKMGRRQQHLFARSPALTYLYGALGDGPAEVVLPRRQRARQADRVGDLQATKEERLHKFKGNSEETDAKVNELFRKLVVVCKKAKGAVPYFEFIFDPDDFGVSVENAFHASFLVHSGLVKIYTDDESGLPVIGLFDQEGAAQGQGAERRAVVVNITMEDWRRLRPRPSSEPAGPEPAPRSQPGRLVARGGRAGLAPDSKSGRLAVQVPVFEWDEEDALDNQGDTVEVALDDISDEDSVSIHGSGDDEKRRVAEAAELKADGRTVEAVVMVDYEAGYPRRKFPLSDAEFAAMQADRHPSYPAVERSPEDGDSEDGDGDDGDGEDGDSEDRD